MMIVWIRECCERFYRGLIPFEELMVLGALPVFLMWGVSGHPDSNLHL